MKIDSTDNDGELLLDPTNVEQAHVADIDAHAGSSRVPVLLCGPLLHRLGEAFIPDLGGCRIGERPINYHSTCCGSSAPTCRSGRRACG